MNIAGIIQPFVKVNQLDLSMVEKVMNVNFYGTLYMVKAFLPHLLKRPSAHVLNVSSMGGFLPVPGQSIYGASKAAVKLFTEGLSSELAGTNVGVSIVFPGAIGTNITQNSNVEIPGQGANNTKYKVMSAGKAAELIVEAMEKNKFRVLVGSDASFMDKLCRLAPVFAKNFIAKKMGDLLK
jgi:short-subunit dehydrogenase